MAKDQKPASQNKVHPVMNLRLQDGRERERERERKVKVSLKEQASFCRAFASVGSFCNGVEIASLLRGRRSWGFARTCHTAVLCGLDSIKLSVEYAEI
jgi:hypothetical protein